MNLAHTISTMGCSGALVRFPGSQPSDPAIAMTNGHCIDATMKPDTVLVNQPAKEEMSLKDGDGKTIMDLKGTRLLYGTQKKTDVAFYSLNKTFKELQDAKGDLGRPLEIAPQKAQDGINITIVGAFWKGITKCRINGFVYQLEEDKFFSSDSIRYSPECVTKGGWSGSPIIDPSTYTIVGIHNTASDDGKMCTGNNPCEIDQNGKKTAKKGQRYGQQVWWVHTCLNAAMNAIDLNAQGCLLPKP